MNVAFTTPTDLRCGLFTSHRSISRRRHLHFKCSVHPNPKRSTTRIFHHHYRRRPCHHPLTITATSTASSASSSNSPWTSQESSTALNYHNKMNSSATKYIDLRTMKIILPEDAHLNPSPPSNHTFSPVPPSIMSSTTATDKKQVEKLEEIFFTDDTIQLSETQKKVVYELLCHRSVIYTYSSPDEKYLLFIDIVMRCRVWKKSIVYCASSRRVAESMFTSLLSQLGNERRHEILLDLGDGVLSINNKQEVDESVIRVVITVPSIIRNGIISLGDKKKSMLGWMSSISILFIDNLTDSSLSSIWEEILLSLPSSIQLCILSSYLTRPYLELLPIWIETIHNTTSVITSITSTFNLNPSSLILNRIERPPKGLPLLRTFVYNATIHKSPVQVSLTILKDLLLKEIDDSSIDSLPDYGQAFLHGITMIPCEDPKQLLFSTADEAVYADIAALIVADAKRTEEAMKIKNKRRDGMNLNNKGKKKERTPSSRAAARRRRDTAYSQSMLMPAIVLVKGHKKTMDCAKGIQSALLGKEEKKKKNSIDLLWDDDTKDHVYSIVQSLKNVTKENETEQQQLTYVDLTVLNLLCSGIGVVNDKITPCVRVAAEELFRAGMISILIADTHLGSDGLSSLSAGKSVIIEGECIAACDDMNKGLISASTVASLSGRRMKDDVGNLLLLWYDESVDDEAAGYEIGNSLLTPELNIQHDQPSTETKNAGNGLYGQGVMMMDDMNDNNKGGFTHVFNEGAVENFEVKRGVQSNISSNYGVVLRSLRRFGIDGNEIIFEYTLNSFKGWLKRAAVHATLEKMNVEKNAFDERINREDWSEIADYGRRTAKVREVRRVFNAMTSRLQKVLERKMLNELRKSTPGRIIGIRLKPQSDANRLLTDKSEAQDVEEESTENVENVEKKDGDVSGLSGKLSSAVFVTVFDQDVKGKHILGMEHQYLVVCIMADGLWTMVPLQEVESITYEEDSDSIINNVDLLSMPHPATFDLEPGLQMAKSTPVDESEQASLHRISDDLINLVTSDQPPELYKMEIPEFEEQRAHMTEVEALQQKSRWYNRDKEINDLRKLRKRCAELGDEMEVLRKRKELFENEIKEKMDDCMSVQTSLMAVLEDCHALVFQNGQQVIQMTPIGSLAAVLPCEYSVFSAACLCLVDDMEDLDTGDFAAFIAIVISKSKVWNNQNHSTGRGRNARLNNDNNNVRKQMSEMRRTGIHDDFEQDFGDDEDDKIKPYSSNQNEYEEAWVQDRRKMSEASRKLKEILPNDMSELIVEIQQALHQLHRRHLSECQGVKRVWIKDIVPKEMNHRISKIASEFTNGKSWNELDIDDDECTSGYVVDELRNVCFVLRLIWKDELYGEFSEKCKDLAGRTLVKLLRWPIADDEVVFKCLMEGGVVDKAWNGNTYDKWWKSVKNDFKQMQSLSNLEQV